MDRNRLRRIVRRLPIGTLRDTRPLRYCYEHRSFGLRAGSAQGFPFYSKHAAWVLCGMLLTLATVRTFSSLFYPGIAEHLAIVASIAGGLGIALMILIWSELYGCMNPMRVAFYYSGSIIVGALMIYIYRGFAIPWLFVMTSILPIFSLLCAAARSFNVLPGDNLPSTTWAKFSVPWKIIILMAIYAFAYGLLGEIPLCRHVRPPFGTGHRRGRARGYGGRCSAGQELRLRHHIPHGPAAYGGRAHHSFGIGPVRLVLGQLLRHRRLYGILDSHHAHSGQHLLPLRRFGDMALRH